MKITELIEILEKAEKFATEDLHKLGAGSIIHKHFPEKVPVTEPTSISFKWMSSIKGRRQSESYIEIQYNYYGVYFRMKISLEMIDGGIPEPSKYIAINLSRAVLRFVSKQNAIRMEEGRPKGHY